MEPEGRAAIYARVSSQQQAAAHTIASQIEALKARVKADGLQLEADLCFFDDGYSGSTLLRPALERLRDQAAAGCFDRLYVHSPDRLARRYVVQVLLVEELQRHGIEIVFLNNSLGRGPEENFLLQMQGVVAEYERTKILERSRRGKRHSAQVGHVSALSRAPYGYRYVSRYAGGGQARYEVDEAKAEVVRQIFRWLVLERCSLGTICRRLQKQAIPSPSGRARWTRTSVWKILGNSTYVGRAHFGKTRVGPPRPRLRPGRGRPAQPRYPAFIYKTALEERITIPVPALIDEELFAGAAEQLAENRRQRDSSLRGRRFLLQGLIVCGQCGYGYYGKPIYRRLTRTGRPPGYAYYWCGGNDSHRFGGERICNSKGCRTDMLDEAVWQDVAALLAEPERIRQEYERRLCHRDKRPGRPVDQLSRLSARVQSGINRLIDAYQDGYLQRQEFESRIRGARDRLARLEAEAKAVAEHDAQGEHLQTAVDQLHKFAARVRNGIQDADWLARREILRALIKHIEVGPDAVRIIYKVAPTHPVQGPTADVLQDCSSRARWGVGIQHKHNFGERPPL
jgi:site-specific DNA recombinase